MLLSAPGPFFPAELLDIEVIKACVGGTNAHEAGGREHAVGRGCYPHAVNKQVQRGAGHVKTQKARARKAGKILCGKLNEVAPLVQKDQGLINAVAVVEHPQVEVALAWSAVASHEAGAR